MQKHHQLLAIFKVLKEKAFGYTNEIEDRCTAANPASTNEDNMRQGSILRQLRTKHVLRHSTGTSHRIRSFANPRNPEGFYAPREILLSTNSIAIFDGLPDGKQRQEQGLAISGILC